ncbi:MAG: DnaJ domain-containing protein [Candidatus Sericytochromatia bacterium]|nr:DnaJ domain-containing protein [Candidatus Sericytochromatia bacterium]
MELWEEDLYELLGVEETATSDEIRKAYKKLAIELHPDRFPDDPAKRDEATTRFSKVTNAYNILKDEEERAEYDFARRLGFAGSSAPAAKGGGGTPGKSIDDDGNVSEARQKQARNQYEAGLVAHKAKNWSKCIQHYKEAARLDPTVADYPAYLGLAYHQQGLKTPANKAFEQALKLDKKHKIVRQHYQAPGQQKAESGGFFGKLMALFGGKKDSAKGDAKPDAKGAKGKPPAKGKPEGKKKSAGRR